MRHLLAAFVVFFALVAAGPAAADFDDSRAWFDGLTTDERSAVQSDLTLLGFYEYLVDGQFGRGTYQALRAYQRSLGRAETGVLLDRDKDRLQRSAASVYRELGMDLVRDKQGQAALIMPAGLLTVVEPAERGNSYSTPDGGISLVTARRPIGERAFRALFEEQSEPTGDRSITYANFNNDRFVISGTQRGRPFYTMFQNAETDSVGYSLSWSEENAERASMLAIFIASHFTALRYLPAEEVKQVETASATQKFGVFTLPANPPDVIMMNGEVTHTLASDFTRALRARPDARIIVLNSPGGYVDNALQVAHEVRRRNMSTVVGKGMGCYSACAYIFFAGVPRYAEGELGVHQISAEVADLVLAQTTLGDVLDALDAFGVEQHIISVMLRTPPEKMYVFTSAEIAELRINLGEPIRIAELSIDGPPSNAPADETIVSPPADDVAPAREETGSPSAAFVQLSLQSTEAEAERSLQYALERWAPQLNGAAPEIVRREATSGVVFLVRVPSRSLESANALCAAIKSAGGGCYVTDT